MASEAFKILNKLSPSYIQDLVNEKVSHYNFRNKKQVEIPQVNSKRSDMMSFRFEAARNVEQPLKWIQNGWELPAIQEAAADLGWYEL